MVFRLSNFFRYCVTFHGSSTGSRGYYSHYARTSKNCLPICSQSSMIKFFTGGKYLSLVLSDRTAGKRENGVMSCNE